MKDQWEDVAYDGVVAETDKAILVSIGKEKYWLPRFAIREWDEKEKTLELRGDIAVEKGLA